MSTESRVAAMQADMTLQSSATPTLFLNGVLSATGITLTTGKKNLALTTMTRDEMMRKFAAQANAGITTFP